MIIEWFLMVMDNVQTWLLDIQPEWEPPTFFLEIDSHISGFFDNFDGLGVWADWAYIALLVTLVFATWIVCLLIKLARAVASYLMPGWGAA